MSGVLRSASKPTNNFIITRLPRIHAQCRGVRRNASRLSTAVVVGVVPVVVAVAVVVVVDDDDDAELGVCLSAICANRLMINGVVNGKSLYLFNVTKFPIFILFLFLFLLAQFYGQKLLVSKRALKGLKRILSSVLYCWTQIS